MDAIQQQHAGGRVWRRLTVLALVAVAGLALAVPPPADAGSICHQPLTTGDNVEVVIAHVCFEPSVLYVQPGAEVTWTNRDPVQHNVLGARQDWGSQLLDEGDSFSHAFDEPGVFPYYCALHMAQVGVVVVGDPQPDDVAPAMLEATDASAGGTSPWLVLAVGAVAVLGVAGLGGAYRVRGRRG